MCLFCAGIPATISVGAATRGKINERRKQVEQEIPDPSETRGRGKAALYRLPVEKITLIMVAILLLCAITYHTVIGPRFGI